MLHRRVRLLLDRDYRVEAGRSPALEASRGLHWDLLGTFLLSMVTLTAARCDGAGDEGGKASDSEPGRRCLAQGHAHRRSF